MNSLPRLKQAKGRTRLDLGHLTQSSESDTRRGKNRRTNSNYREAWSVLLSFSLVVPNAVFLLHIAHTVFMHNKLRSKFKYA
jgi:hypothetical protein